MTFDFYADVSILSVSFSRFLIGSLKQVLLRSFLRIFLVYNNRRLMRQINTMKKNPKNLGLNPGQLVRLVPDWVDCRVD